MFPQLIDKSFIKQSPDKNSHVFSFFINGARRYFGINESAGSILGLCDGTHSIEEIILILTNKYEEDYNLVRKNVQTFLKPFIENNLVIDNKTDKPKNIVKGSFEIFYPDSICWEITDYCPLNCIHCYLPKKNNIIISKNEIDRILEIIDSIGIQQVQITGGEALTHPELEYIIDNLIDRGIITHISTSGFSFNTNIFKYLTRLKEVQGSQLRISLDGFKNIHNSIRQNESSYDNAIEFIKKIIDIRIPCQIETTVIDQSKKAIEDFVIFIKGLGVNSIEISKLSVQGNALKNNLTFQWDSKDFDDFLYELDSKYSSKTFRIRVPKNDEKSKNCGAGYRIIRIRPNFDVTPCPVTEFNLGNLHENTLNQIMTTSGHIFSELECPKGKFCNKCEKEYNCKFCTAIGYSNKDKVKQCRWFECMETYLKPFLD